MIGASLKAAEVAKNKAVNPRIHVAPSGAKYEADHDFTPAERKRLDAYDLSQHGSVKLGGKADPTIKTEKQPSGGLFAKTATATKEGLAEAEKYAASKGVNLKPGQSSAMQRKAIGNIASAKAADFIEPVTGPASDFLANLATWIDPLAGFAEKKKPGSVKGAAKSLLEGPVTGPIQTVTSAGILTDPTATLTERGLSGAELLRDALLATTHITLPKVGGALKKIFKGAEKAGTLERAVFTSKELEGYTSPSNLSEAGVPLKTGENPAVAAKKAELDARRAARNAPKTETPKETVNPVGEGTREGAGGKREAPLSGDPKVETKQATTNEKPSQTTKGIPETNVSERGLDAGYSPKGDDAFPVNARAKRTSINGAVAYPRLVGGKFTPDEIESVTKWGKGRGYTINASPTKINIVGDDGVAIERSINSAKAATKADIKAQEDLAAFNARRTDADAKNKATVSSDAGKWVDDTFGSDFANDFNKAALVRFIKGEDAKFQGIASSKWRNGLEKIGGITSDGKVDFDAVKKAWNKPEFPTPNTPKAPEAPQKPVQSPEAANVRSVFHETGIGDDFKGGSGNDVLTKTSKSTAVVKESDNQRRIGTEVRVSPHQPVAVRFKATVTPEDSPIKLVRDLHKDLPTTKAQPKGKVNRRTGLTPEQEAYLSDALAKGAKDGGDFSIHVPGDGKFTIENPRQASTLHQAMTGKPLDGIEPLKTKAPYRGPEPRMSPQMTDDDIVRLKKTFGTLDAAASETDKYVEYLRSINASPSNIKVAEDTARIAYTALQDEKRISLAMKAPEPSILGSGKKTEYGNKYFAEYTDATGETRRTSAAKTKYQAEQDARIAAADARGEWLDARKRSSKLASVDAEIAAVKARRDARLKSTTTKGTKQRGAADFTKDDFNDALELAELYVKKVGYTFEQYAKEMVDYFGDGVKPHLKEIWDTHVPKSPEMPTVSVPKTKTEDVTGIANQVLDREAAQGLINEVEKGTGKNAEHWQKEGQKAVQAGQDPVSLARRIANGEEDPTPLKFGILQEGKAMLQRRLNSAAPGKDFEEALSEMDKYLADVQSGKGIWSDMGRALQAGTELDTGNFAQVIERVQKQGGKLNPKMEQQFRDMTEKVKAAEGKLAETERLLKEEQAKRTTASQAKKSPRFSKEDLDIELDQLLKEFGQKASKLSAGIDPELLPVMGKIAVNYMKRGVNTLDDVVAAVQSHFKDATYEDIVSGIDAATKGTTRTRSELQKEIARLKNQAKSDVRVRTQIKSLQEQLRTGDYEVPTKREITINKRLEDLRLEKGLLSNEVKSRIGETQPKTGWQTVTNVLNAPKSIKSSVDISAAGRQGWVLGAANPDKIPAAFADQLKAMASPKGALKAQNALLERPNASKYKRMGLYIAPLEGHGEEAFKGTVFPKWSKLNPFQGSSRAYTAYLNRMRVDVADRLIKWAGPNATDDDLKVIGNYINVASGRGGKSIHLEGKIAESLNNVFFSPRFVASRFELALGQPLMTSQGAVAKSLKGRALVAQQYAATIGTVGSILALAKHMNPDMNTTDPTKPDYMSPKVGDTKIDVLAGLRQTVNLGAKLLDKDRNEFQKGADVGRFIRSKASPAAGSAYSLYTGKDYIGQPYGIKDALTDLVSPLSVQELVEGAKKDGWNQDDFLGLLNFLGFNTQTYKPKEDKKDRPN